MEIQKIYKRLEDYQKENISEQLRSYIDINKINPITINNLHISCPHCGSHDYVKNGVTCNRQRYKCSKCSRTFSATTNTCLHKLHKVNKWTGFIHVMMESTVPPTLKELCQKLRISKMTAHTWKHKLLSAMNEQQQMFLSGIFEMDEVFLPFCVKGRRGKEKTREVKEIESRYMDEGKNSMFLCIHNRKGDFNFFPIKIQQKGQVKATDIKKIVETLNIAENTIVVTDGSKASTKYFKTRTDITHEVFISKGKKTKIKHNNNVNVTMKLYKDWSNRFKGYSTKYLWNYLNWFRFHRKFKQEILKYVVGYSVKDAQSYDRHKNIPLYYENYLKAA